LDDLDIGTLILWMIAELAFGAAIGLAVMFIAEALAFGAQIIGLQAGYAYASVVDPMTQAESDVLPVLSQLAAGLLFFTTGLHRLLIRAFSDSLHKYPPGAFHMSTELGKAMIALASGVFSVGVRLALPVVALLFMTDVALALVGRINSQLHLGMHAFPAKMLLGMMLLAVVLAVWPALYQGYASGVIDTIRRTLTG
jgi:flagellar biosynthetic protein FliR